MTRYKLRQLHTRFYDFYVSSIRAKRIRPAADMPRYAKICQDMPSYEATAQDLEGIPEKRPWEHVDVAHCPPEFGAVCMSKSGPGDPCFGSAYRQHCQAVK